MISEADHGKSLRSSMNLEQSGACEGQFEEDYRALRPLGKGAFGVVWLASRRRDEQEVKRPSLLQNRMAETRRCSNPFSLSNIVLLFSPFLPGGSEVYPKGPGGGGVLGGRP